MTKRWIQDENQLAATPLFEALERRVLLSADLLPISIAPDFGEDAIAADAAVLSARLDAVSASSAADTVRVSPAEPADVRNELVFVDAAVTGHEQLVGELGGQDGVQREIIILDSARDGIEQISESLAKHDDLAAVHIISHGSDGEVRLGSSWLDAETLSDRSAVIASWGDALSLDGDLFIYGCNLAGSERGEAFLTSLSELTGADVAASVDATGSAVLGGDWDLEYRVGEVQGQLALASYDGLLVEATLLTTGDATVQAGAVFTLNLDASDLGAASVTGWTINWGDGSIDTIVGNPPTATHSYTTAGFTYNITASADDETGTHLQNNLIVASSDTDSAILFENTTGDFDREFETGASIKLDYPDGVIIGPDGLAYVAAFNSGTINRFDPTTGVHVDEFVSKGDGGMKNAEGLAFGPDGNLYAVDYGNDKVLKFDGTTGDFIEEFIDMSGEVNGPTGLLFGPDGDLYVSGYESDNIYKYDGTTGALISGGPLVTNATAGLKDAESMAFGPDGNLYVASEFQAEIHRYDPTTGALIGGGPFVTSGSGGLLFPTGVAFGPDGNLYVASWGTSQILRYDGTTGAFIDVYADDSGDSDLLEPMYFAFVPGHQVTVTSADPVGPISDTDTSTNEVNESAANGTAVGITALATDPDDSVSYTLDDDADGRFVIESSSGIVKVLDNTQIDFEIASSHNITVRATSADTSFSTAVMVINVLDDTSEFSITDVTDAELGTNSVSESAANGTVVEITASASDGDDSDSITYTLDDDAEGRFEIDAGSGVVRVLDRDLLDFETDTSHSVTIRATSDDGSFKTLITSIAITDDTSEFGVTDVMDADLGTNSVSENAANGTVVGVTASASDADAADDVSYSLDDDAGGRFEIDAGSGVVRVLDRDLLDFETATSHSVTIRATSDDGSFNTLVASIAIADDTSEFSITAVADADASANSVGENAANGTAVGITASASDGDASDGISYLLIDDAGGRFEIDASSGVISVLDGALLNYESATSHSVMIRATSDDGSFSNIVETIDLVDDTSEFSIGSLMDGDASANSVGESAANGTAVGIMAVASDADGSDDITYSLDDDAGGRFQIDASSGVISVRDRDLLDYETATSHSVRFRATSDDGSSLSLGATITLTDDTNEFSVGPLTDADGSANSVSENSAMGALVGITAFASDADLSDGVTYSLDDDAGGRFAIDAVTGVVTVLDAAALDYESASGHTIVLRATSGDGSSSTANLTIDLADVNEAPMLADLSASVLATATTGSVVGTMTGFDVDGGDTLTFAIITGNTNGAFAINPSTGLISVADSAALESAGTSSFALTIEVRDAAGLTDSATATIEISSLSNIAGLSEIVEDEDEENTEETEDDAEGIAATSESEPEPDSATASDEGAPSQAGSVVLAPFAELTGQSSRTLPALSLASTEARPASAASSDPATVDAPAVPRVASPPDSATTQGSLGDRMLNIQTMRLALEEIGEELASAAEERTLELEKSVAVIERVGIALSTGVLALITRGSSLLAAALSAVPMWGRVDPLAVLALSAKEREERARELKAAAESEDREGDHIKSLLDRKTTD